MSGFYLRRSYVICRLGLTFPRPPTQPMLMERLFGVKHGQEGLGSTAGLVHWRRAQMTLTTALARCRKTSGRILGIIKESFPQFSLFIALDLWRTRHRQIPSRSKARSLPELAPDV